MNREEWLTIGAKHLATSILEPNGFRELAASNGGGDWSRLRFATSWPSKKALSVKNRTIGQCWPSEASEGGLIEIFISPAIAESTRVLDVLLHEMLHAAVGNQHKHDRVFSAACGAVGLDGKPTATIAGEDLLGDLAEIVRTIGCEYPHRVLDRSSLPKQTTRALKAYCPNAGCSSVAYSTNSSGKKAFSVHITRQWWNAYGPEGEASLSCPACETALVLQGEE